MTFGIAINVWPVCVPGGAPFLHMVFPIWDKGVMDVVEEDRVYSPTPRKNEVLYTFDLQAKLAADTGSRIVGEFASAPRMEQ